MKSLLLILVALLAVAEAAKYTGNLVIKAKKKGTKVHTDDNTRYYTQLSNGEPWKVACAHVRHDGEKFYRLSGGLPYNPTVGLYVRERDFKQVKNRIAFNKIPRCEVRVRFCASKGAVYGQRCREIRGLTGQCLKDPGFLWVPRLEGLRLRSGGALYPKILDAGKQSHQILAHECSVYQTIKGKTCSNPAKEVTGAILKFSPHTGHVLGEKEYRGGIICF